MVRQGQSEWGAMLDCVGQAMHAKVGWRPGDPKFELAQHHYTRTTTLVAANGHIQAFGRI